MRNYRALLSKPQATGAREEKVLINYVKNNIISRAAFTAIKLVFSSKSARVLHPETNTNESNQTFIPNIMFNSNLLDVQPNYL